MTELFTPPKTIDEIPEKLMAAWRELGAEMDDNAQQALLRSWEQNRSLSHHPTSAIKAVVEKKIPVETWPDWKDAVRNLLESQSDAVAAKNIILVEMLGYFLDGATLFQLPALHNTITSNESTHRITHLIPRHHEERERMAQVLHEITDADAARHMLCVIARNGVDRSDESRAKKEALIKKLLSDLSAEILDFKPPRSQYSNGLAYEFVDKLRDPQLLEQLMRKGSQSLRLAAISKYAEAIKGLDWSPVMDVLREHPEDIEKAGLYNIDLPVIELLWNTGKKKSNRRFAAERLFNLIDYVHDPDSRKELAHDASAYTAMLQQMLDDDAKLVVNIAKGEYEFSGALTDLSPQALTAVWQLQHKALMELCLPALSYRFKEYAYFDEDEDYEDEEEEYKQHYADIKLSAEHLVREVLVQQREQFTELKPGQLAALLKYVDNDALLETLSENLKPIAAKSKSVQQQLAQGMATVTPALIDNLGWLNDKRKGVRAVPLEALLLSDHPDAANYLQRLHSDAKLGDGEKERILLRLEKLGANTESLETTDGDDLEQLQEIAAKAKIKSAQIDKVWSESLQEMLAPLDTTVGRWLLNLALDSKDDPLPRAGKKALQHITAENRARLAEQLTQLWLAGNGDRKLRWLMKFVPDCGDDRLVEPLFEAFKGWNKRAKPKSVYVLETLGSLNTSYALAQVHEVYTKNSYSYSLNEAAGNVLKAAAKQRGIDLFDLFDELTPDFGLKSEGLTMDVGPRSYTITVAADLSLRVRNDESDKITKTLPKARTDEDADKRAALESSFQLLRRNLKKVAKQQAKRLQDALICNRRWPLVRWQTLFVEHPLLGLVAQGFIWQRWDAEGNRCESFRISEDRSLIMADDETVELQEKDLISLWHPVLDDEQSQIDWQTHLNDYEIKPLLEQAGLPRLLLDDKELQSKDLKRFTGLEVEQLTVKRYMESWNYEVDDQDGSWIAGYSRRFPMLNTKVVISITEGVSVFPMQGDMTKLDDISFYNGGYEPVALKDLPPTLLATVLQQGEALRASATGK